MCETRRQALHTAPHLIQVIMIRNPHSSCPFPLFSEKPIHFKAPSVSNCNCSFISLDASDRIIIQTCFGKIGDLLAQLQRKTQKPDHGKERDRRGAVWASFRTAGAWGLKVPRITFLTPLFFSLGVGSFFFNAACLSPYLRGTRVLPTW